MDTLILEIGIAVALVASVGLLSHKLRMSVIPFFILIGMAVGSHAPDLGFVDLQFKESKPFLDFMGRLGVLFLLFYLGLEFSVGRLIKSGKSILMGGSAYVVINFLAGTLVGSLMGLTFAEIMVIAGIMVSSSTVIVAKVLTDLRRTANPETEVIMGMIMFDDLFIAMHLSFLSGLVLSGGGSVWQVVGTVALALTFILTFLILGRRIVPAIDRVLQVPSSELFILVIFALLFFTAGFSESIHVAEAIGALMAGLVLADSRYIKRIETMVLPYKDFFGAMFFFSFGLSIDPRNLGGAVMWAVLAAVVTLLANLGSGYFASRVTRTKPRTSFDIGFTLSARGEFSIIMANIGKAGKLDPIIQSFVVVYVLLLSVISPILTKESRRIWDATLGRREARAKAGKQRLA